MDQHTPTGETVPMDKQETVKDDGRTLIYYTFLAENDAPQTAGGNTETSHV